jgi:hypothetical protein
VCNRRLKRRAQGIAFAEHETGCATGKPNMQRLTSEVSSQRRRRVPRGPGCKLPCAKAAAVEYGSNSHTIISSDASWTAQLVPPIITLMRCFSNENDSPKMVMRAPPRRPLRVGVTDVTTGTCCVGHAGVSRACHASSLRVSKSVR